MLSAELILSNAHRPHTRIGLGVGADREKANEAVLEAEDRGYGSITLYSSSDLLARDLREGKIDAAVRGDMDSNLAMSALRRCFHLDKVQRAAFVQPPGGRMFLLAPVGIDEGWTVEDKLEFILRGTALLRRMGLEPTVGVMSGGRRSDIGRSGLVDRSIDDAEEVVRLALEKGIKARHVQILIEEAARECDLIIAPEGISGNIIFRTLHFLGGGRAMGAPVLNIDKIYIDTSRAKTSYGDSIALASVLAGR